MSKLSWTARRKAKLDLCVGSFAAQFHEWKTRTEQPRWSTHHSQVRAIETLLVEVSRKVSEAARDAEGDADYAESLPQFERAMLSGWRVWEFFRSKFAQRQEEQFQPGLRAADELAWACRIPLAAAAAKAGNLVPKEPALVYLNGNASPVALARGRNFWAESAPGMGQLDTLCDELLKHVPVPLISLPWHEIWHIPSLTAVAHEAGHVVEEDFGLTEDLNAAIKAAVKEAGGAASEANWLRWRAEVFADFFAVRHCGPAFVGMLGDLLAGLSSVGEAYPPVDVRMELCFVGLEQMGLVDEAAKRRAAWQEIDPAGPLAPDFAAVPFIVKHLATHPLPKFGDATFADLVTFDSVKLEKANQIKDDLGRGKTPQLLASTGAFTPGPGSKEDDLPQLIAAGARFLYEADPTAFSNEAASLDVINLIAAVNAGQRRGVRRAATAAAVTGAALEQAISAAAAMLLRKPDSAPAVPKSGKAPAASRTPAGSKPAEMKPAETKPNARRRRNGRT